MTNEEREIITGYIQRVSGASQIAQGSVPTQALAPVDREADALIGDLFARLPEARYRLTQTAFVQEHALTQAQNRIKQLEYELDQAKRASQGGFGGPQPAAPQPSRGFFGGLFGGAAAPQRPQYQPGYGQPQYQPPPPPPQYAPGYQPGMFQRSGSGFLGSALTTAAGVAGGLVAGNALMDLFSGHHGMGGGFGGAQESTSVFPPGTAEASPWAGAAGGSPWDNQGAVPDQSGWGDSGGSSGWDNVSSSDAGSDGGWGGSDGGGDSGGGFDNG